MADRTLVAWLDKQPVGRLQESGGIWSFAYDATWLNNPEHFSLAPGLPVARTPIVDESSQRPVQWYFDNLLPEGAQRDLLAGDARIDVADAFGLLQYYGAESAGSLTLLPPSETPPPEVKYRALSNEQLQGRIAALPQVPLSHSAAKKMSLAGAQHKLAIALQGEQMLEPVAGAASTHILKPDHPDITYAHSAINEWFVMRLARALKLPVPAVSFRQSPAPVYVVERFDRDPTVNPARRLHAIDACQLLNLAPAFKYQQGSVNTLAELANCCRIRPAARLALFRWLVFNVLVGNTDAHLKNLSFLVSPDGIKLAPHYDLLCTAIWETLAMDGHGWPDHTALAWPLLEVRLCKDISRDVLREAAKVIGIGDESAQRVMNWLAGNVLGAADNLIAEVERDKIAAGGEMRMLRAVRYVVMKEMQVRVARKG